MGISIWENYNDLLWYLLKLHSSPVDFNITPTIPNSFKHIIGLTLVSNSPLETLVPCERHVIFIMFSDKTILTIPSLYLLSLYTFFHLLHFFFLLLMLRQHQRERQLGHITHCSYCLLHPWVQFLIPHSRKSLYLEIRFEWVLVFFFPLSWFASFNLLVFFFFFFLQKVQWLLQMHLPQLRKRPIVAHWQRDRKRWCCESPKLMPFVAHSTATTSNGLQGWQRCEHFGTGRMGFMSDDGGRQGGWRRKRMGLLGRWVQMGYFINVWVYCFVGGLRVFWNFHYIT